MTTFTRPRAPLLFGLIVVALYLPIVFFGASDHLPRSRAATHGGAPLVLDIGSRASLTPSGAVLSERRAFDIAQTSVGPLSSLAVHVALLIAAVAIRRAWSPRRAPSRARYATRDPPVPRPA